MNQPATETYWQGKLSDIKKALEKNNFEAWIADTKEQAYSIVMQDIYNKIQPTSISFGGSITVQELGIYSDFLNKSDIQVIDTYDSSISREEMIERRRESLLVDMYITGTNAVTYNGHLINLDGMGNRVAALTFGPRNVVLLIGRNKIVPDLEKAISRIKEYSAPVNTIRLNKKTPCAQSMQCEDCNSPDRICNTWTITEKSNPPQRVKIVLINSEIGF